MNNFARVGVSAFDLRCLLQIIHLGNFSECHYVHSKRAEEKGKKKTMWGLFMEIPNYKKTVLHYFAFRYLFFLSLNFLKFCWKAVVMQSIWRFLDRCVIARRTVVFYSGTGFVSCSADALVPRRTVVLYTGAGSTWTFTEEVVPRRTVFFSRGTPTLSAMVLQQRRRRRPWCSVFYNLFDRGLFQENKLCFHWRPNISSETL